MTNHLTQSDYHKLLETISNIYFDSHKQAHLAVNKIRVHAYWEIGRHIVKVEQANKLRAAYGEHLLKDLSKDLSEKFGNGFSSRNLRYMQKFYIAYPNWQTSAKLPWSHYQVLSTIRDKRARESLEKKLLNHHLSTRELKQEIKNRKITIEAVASENQLALPLSKTVLRAKRGKLYTYRLIFEPISLKDLPGNESRSGTYLVDLGFQVRRKLELKSLPFLKDQMLVETTKKKGSFSLKQSIAKPAALYTYKAYLDRVIDGDTLLCLIDLGFNTWTRQRLRLRAINTPELSTQKGKDAKKYVEQILKSHPYLIVKTHKSDKYGRYLVDVWADETYLNHNLLTVGLAKIY